MAINLLVTFVLAFHTLIYLPTLTYGRMDPGNPRRMPNHPTPVSARFATVVADDFTGRNAGGGDVKKRFFWGQRRLANQLPVYINRTTGQCNAGAGESPLTSKSACRDAAVQNGWTSTTPTNAPEPSDPKCYQYESKLYYNSNSNSNPGDCSPDKVCLCGLNCQAGQYQTIDASSVPICAPCQTGQYQDSIGQDSCKDDCNAGSSINDDKTACNQCALGQYQDQANQIGCKSNCTAGFFINFLRTACNQCDEQYQDQAHQSSCKD